MNCVDYLFEKTSDLKKDLILGTQETITYRSVYANSCQLAAFLKEKIGSDKKIILISQNSVFYITAYLGILKSGNVCVPLNPSIEQKNFDFILAKTHCEFAFISGAVLKKLDVSIENHSESDYLSICSEQKTNNGRSSEFDEIGRASWRERV